MTQVKSITKFHNNLAEARYIMSPTEQKIFIYAVTQIDQEKKNFNEVELSIKELAKVADLNVNSMLTKERLRKHIKNIMRTVIETWDVENSKNWKMYNLTQTAEHVEGSGIIKFKFNTDMIPLLLDLQKHFFLQSPEVIKFKSSHSVRIYDFFRAKAYEMNEWCTTIEEFKKILGLEGKYKKWQDFERKVLTPAMREIPNSDLILNCEMRKRGRSAHYLYFDFELNSSQLRNEFKKGSTKFKHVVDELREFLDDKVKEFSDGEVYEFYCLSEVHEANFNDTCKYISRTIDYMNRPMKVSIKNKYSYLKKSLKEGYVHGQMTLDI